MKGVAGIFLLAILAILAAPVTAQEKKEVVFVSPSGALEIESVLENSSAANTDATADIWVVSTKDRTQRARLPKQEPDSPLDDEFLSRRTRNGSSACAMSDPACAMSDPACVTETSIIS